jgi:hypothetical protein
MKRMLMVLNPKSIEPTGDRQASRVFSLVFIALASLAQAEPRQDSALIIVGAEGTAEYGKGFAAQAKVWQESCTKAGIAVETIGLNTEAKTTDKAAIKTRLEKEAQAKDQPGTLWLVMLGHGTFDGREAKLSLRGEDVSAEQLGSWLKSIAREVVFIDTASASAPFLKACVGPRRILVSATKSGDEVFYSRFGEPFAKAISGAEEADLDQDKQVSVLEAFLYASKQVDKFYETEERIATEHAMLDDSGDGIGSRASMFDGVRGKSGVADGLRAHELHLVLSEVEAKIPADIRAKRDELERAVRDVVAKRSTMKEDEYYQELEKLFLEIAKLSK